MTGRTSPRFCKFQLEDINGDMCDIPVSSLGSVGLTYEEIDVSAMQELVKTFLAGQATFSMTISGPFDNSAAVTASASGESAAASLSGSFTVLEPLNGLLGPLAFGVYFGVATDWTSGDPVFGADASVIVTDFTMDPSAGTYSAKLAHVSGGTAPYWDTAIITPAT